MDFKGWEKIEEDKKSVKLKHPKGHTMTIALSSLPGIQREALKRLKMAKGGEVPNYDEGTPDHPVSSADSTDQGSSDQSSNGDVTHNGSPININIGTPQAQAPQGASPVQQAPIPDQPLVPAAMQGAPGGGIKGAAADTVSGINQGMQSAQVGQQADTELAKSNALANDQFLKQNQNIQNFGAEAYNDISKHTKDFDDYMTQNPQDSMKYIKGMDTGQKMGNAISLFLGGLGVPFGGKNFAYDYLQDRINKNVDDQKANADRQKSVWTAYNDLYHNSQVATELAKASAKDALAKQLDLNANRIGTLTAKQKALAAQSQLKKEAYDHMMNSAAILGNQYNQMQTQGAGAPGSMHPQGTGAPPPQGSGASGSWGEDESQNGRTDRVLTPEAQHKYDWVMNKYNTVMSDKQKDQIQQEYQSAFQTDKALSQIDELYPELMKKRTLGGYLSEKIDPNVIGGMAAAGAEGLGLAGAIPTAGASVVGAIPGAILAGAGGKAVGHGLQQGLRAIGGQTQTQYETAANSLESIVASALPGLTPTERGGIAKEFLPTAVDSEESARDKLNKLKQKLILLTKTPALDSAGMTRQKKEK